MKTETMDWLACPWDQGSLELLSEEKENSQVTRGSLWCRRCHRQFPIEDGIPRFILKDGYVRNFSFQWKAHAKTQLDSASGFRRSEEQFRDRMDVPLDWLKGKLVLDAGCGMGRFAEIALKQGATVVGVDLSFSVDVAKKNLKGFPQAHFVQADLMRLPFAPATFDFIYSFGVLHHTPDAKRAFHLLVKLLKPGGGMSLFVYSADNKGIVYSSAFWRMFTTRLPKRLLYWLCAGSIPLYYLYRLPVIGPLGRGCLVISMEPNWRWRWLDTFDWYSARYQSKHTHAEVARWFKEAGLVDLFIGEGEVTLAGRKPRN